MSWTYRRPGSTIERHERHCDSHPLRCDSAVHAQDKGQPRGRGRSAVRGRSRVALTTSAGRSSTEEKTMEFLVAFEVHVPDGAPASEVEIRQSAEASAAARL